jgi:bile acid-coenzyme A ligase
MQHGDDEEGGDVAGGTNTSRLTSLGDGWDQLAAAEPEAPAVTDSERTASRRELAVASSQLAERLAAAGAGEGSMVTIGLPNGVAFYQAVLACWKVGAVPQPVSARSPVAELRALIEVADPTVVVGLDPGDGRPWLAASDELLGAAAGTGSATAVSQAGPGEAASATAWPVPPSWKALASGGSTGRPKLIVSTTPGAIELVVAGADLLRIGEGETFLCTGPLYHNGPFLFSMTALLRGGHVVVMERFDAARCLELVEAHRVSYLYLVPTMMSRILRLPEAERLGRDVSSLRTAFHLAAPCPPEVKRAWIDWLGPEAVVELYAGTEGQAVTVIDGREWLAHPGSVGRVVVGEMRVLGPDGEELPPGEVGEVWMRPPPGRRTYRYVGATARERDGWESLGDMGSFDADGYLYLADRRTDMVLVGGANVYPAEVEAALEAHPAVLQACVIGLPDEDTGSRLHAVVQTTGEVGDDELRAFLAERLVGYKLPRSFERTAEPLRDEAGKLRRWAIRQARLSSPSPER